MLPHPSRRGRADYIRQNGAPFFYDFVEARWVLLLIATREGLCRIRRRSGSGHFQ